MKFRGYENRLTISGDREALHAIFEVGRIQNPFGKGDGPLNVVYTKAGLEQRIAARKDSDDRLLLIDILLNWPDED